MVSIRKTRWLLSICIPTSATMASLPAVDTNTEATQHPRHHG